MPAHHCLHISEIQSQITEELALSKVSNTSLVSLAQTCKLLHAAAVERLWYRQESIIPLFSCLPEDLIDVDHEYLKIRLRRPIRPEDWERPLYYAQFIKELVGGHPFAWNSPFYYSPEGDVDFHTILDSLKDIQKTPLLRNLRTLHWILHSSDYSQLSIISACLGSKLSELSVHCPRLIPESLLAPILAKSPKLISLELQDSLDYYTHAPEPLVPLSARRKQDRLLSSAFAVCRNLVSASITPFSLAVAIKLSFLPHLEELTVGVGPPLAVDDDEDDPISRVPEAGFRSLRSLTINTNQDIDDFLNLFKMMQHTRSVTDLTINLHEIINQTDTILTMQDLFASILSETAFKETLTSFVLKCREGCWDHVSDSPSVRDLDCFYLSLTNLLEFRNLEYIEVVTPVPLSLSPSLITSMASSWPNIRSLHFWFHCEWPRRHNWRQDPYPPIEALVPLAACPNLDWVSICVDATTISESRRATPELINSIERKPKHEFTHTIPISFSFQETSPISQEDSIPVCVAAFLSSIFWDVFVEPLGRDDAGKKVDWPEKSRSGVPLWGWNGAYGELERIYEVRTGERDEGEMHISKSGTILDGVEKSPAY